MSSIHVTRLLFFFLLQGFSLSFLPTSILTKHMQESSSDEDPCYASSPVSSVSMHLYYRGLSSTPKKTFWFEYLYGRESAESGANAEAVMLKRKNPAVHNRSGTTYYGANVLDFSDSESDFGIWFETL